MEDVIAFVALGIATGSTVYCILFYFLFYLFFLYILSSGMLNRISSHIWSRWYLPISFIQGWIVDPYGYWFFYKPHKVLVLPPHYTEIHQCSSMTGGVEMVIFWGKGFQVFSEPLSKCSWRLSYVFLMTLYPTTPVSVYNATLLRFMVFVCGCHQEVFDGPAPFKVYFNAMFLTYIFIHLLRPFVYGTTM